MQHSQVGVLFLGWACYGAAGWLWPHEASLHSHLILALEFEVLVLLALFLWVVGNGGSIEGGWG